MEKSKFTTVIIIGLLALNLGIIGFLFLNSPDKRPHPRAERMRHNPKKIIVEKLHFDGNQVIEYEKLIDSHKSDIKKYDTAIKANKIALYKLLSKQNVDEKTKDSLITVITVNQKAIEETHFNHFEAIKKLCNKDQLQNFNALTSELERIFTPNKPPRDSND
ncbi:hypothetical protein [Flavobacterium sp.]